MGPSGERVRMRSAITVIALGALAATAGATFAADTFRKLSGREITARFSGMELTDDVHWAKVFSTGGRLSSYSMGKATDGTWRVQPDQICWNENKRSRCYQVWMSGNKVQLRQPGIDIYDEGVLRKPQPRHQP